MNKPGKDRLKDLIKSCIGNHLTIYPDDWCTEYEIDYDAIADHLLANGVIVPPVKVGDVVYCLDDICEGEAVDFSPLIVKQIFIDVRGCKVYAEGAPWSAILRPADFGKTVFLTKEEAEAVLKERSEQS